jgi:hypothetical protein
MHQRGTFEKSSTLTFFGGAHKGVVYTRLDEADFLLQPIISNRYLGNLALRVLGSLLIGRED